MAESKTIGRPSISNMNSNLTGIMDVEPVLMTYQLQAMLDSEEYSKAFKYVN